MPRPTVYVGSDKGFIHVYTLSDDDGTLTPCGDPVPVTPAPSFMALDRGARFLYCIHETHEMDGRPTGAVSAFARDPTGGALAFLNRVDTDSPGPCHVATEPAGRILLVSHYRGGSVSVLRLASDGSIERPADVRFHGEEAKAHAATVDPTGRYAFVTDLGLDTVFRYTIDSEGAKLSAQREVVATMKQGAGPRHMAFHPSSSFAYVINELDSTMSAFNYGADDGTLDHIQTLSTLPADFQKESYCADVHVLPSGRFLFGSNRGHDSIVTFAIDPSDGSLTTVGHETCGGKWPRNFHVHSDGKLMLVANQHSDDVTAYRIDEDTGHISATGAVAQVESPAYVGIVEPPSS